jgi:dipeptidyl aminopeptidase/acylaminoacyl peptidase
MHLFDSMTARVRRTFVTAVAVLAAVIALGVAESFAQTAVPANVLLRNADFAKPVLSPDGVHMAVLARRASAKDRVNVAIVNLDSNRSQFVTPFDDIDVVEVHWVNSTRLVFTVGNAYDPPGSVQPWRQGGMFAVDRDGSNARRIVSPLGDGNAIVLRPRFAKFLHALNDGSDDIVVGANDESFESIDVYRLNTRTARKSLLNASAPADGRLWSLDQSGAPRAVLTQARTRMSSFWRVGDTQRWQKLWEGEFYDPAGAAIVGIDFDGSLLVSSNAARPLPAASGALAPAPVNAPLRETAGIVRADPLTGEFREWIFAHPRVDHGDLVFDPVKKKLVGVRFIDERLQTHWLDEGWRGIQRAIDQALPGQINVLTPPLQSKRMLVVSGSARNPGSVYEYDFATRKLKFLLDFRKDVAADAMVDARYVKFNARDGLPLAAVIAPPSGAPVGRPAPTIVLPYGGPWVQSPCLCFSAETQYFAQRGFAVIVPTTRGQIGLGHRHWSRGFKQWGLAMQDDIADAVDYAVKQGIADPARIAIVGGSYGGYAALQGAAKTPNLYKAAIAMAAPTDLQLFQSITWADYSDTAFQKFIAPILIGDESRDAEQLKATSPVNNASTISAHILLAYGGEDRRIPPQHGTRMRDALERAGKQVEWLYKSDEGHGFAKTENRIEFFVRAEATIRKAFGMR